MLHQIPTGRLTLRNLITMVLSTAYRMMVSLVIDIQTIFPAVYQSTPIAQTIIINEFKKVTIYSNQENNITCYLYKESHIREY